MNDNRSLTVIENIKQYLPTLTPKGRVLGNFILQNPRKAVFMTTKELAESCRVSEATVVRFVGQLGYVGYGDFLQALRDFVDSGLSLLDRVDLPNMQEGSSRNRLQTVILEEMNNLKELYENADVETLNCFVEQIAKSPEVYVIGSRVSSAFSHYLGWSLTKVRKRVHTIRSCDSEAIDVLTNAEESSLVIITAMSRYPNELIRLAKYARRLDYTLMVITDSALCPLIQFAHKTLIAPSRSIPLIGYPMGISCIINCIVLELASRPDGDVKAHQEKLEQAYLEQDLLFSLHNGEFSM